MKFLKFTQHEVETIYPVSKLSFITFYKKKQSVYDIPPAANVDYFLNLAKRETIPEVTAIVFEFYFENVYRIEIKSTREYRDLCKCRDLIVQYLNSTSPDLIDVDWIFTNYTGREDG